MFGALRGKAAFSCACQDYMDTVFRVAVHNTRSQADAEDVTQEVFEALLTCGKRFADREHLKAWLIRVTLNTAPRSGRAGSCQRGSICRRRSHPRCWTR